MSRVAICSAVRTPIGRFLGAFQDQTAADLGVVAARAALERAGLDPAAVGEVFVGNGRQAGGGPNVARQIAVRAGLPVTVPATTINMACGSGLKAILLGADSIRLGRSDVVLATGTESMSGLPFLLPKLRQGYRLGHAPVVDGMYKDGFVCPLADMVMGETAEKLAQELGISREEQDQFALESQRRAADALAAGHFEAELVPVSVPGKKGDVVVAADEHVRPDTTLESLAKLPPVFTKLAPAGLATVTAGNASGITDGAAAVVLASGPAVVRLGLRPLAWLGDARQGGVDPTVMGLGPVPAFRNLESANGMRLDDYDLVELNEAFAAQVIACERELGFDRARLNVNGGAIALGHPIGATGVRIVVTLVHELARRGAKHGLATLCISGGMGIAAHFHREGL